MIEMPPAGKSLLTGGILTFSICNLIDPIRFNFLEDIVCLGSQDTQPIDITLIEIH